MSLKHQGNDIEKIQQGIKQGKNKDQDLMVAGNAIERVHKNIQEFRNYMISDKYFPYIVFLQGSNFATSTFEVPDPYGRKVTIKHDAGNLNRIDRVTAGNYSMSINTNLCRNKIINGNNFQSASLYFKATEWSNSEMYIISLKITQTSLSVIFNHDWVL